MDSRRFLKERGEISKYLDESQNMMDLLGYVGKKDVLKTKVDFNTTVGPLKIKKFDFNRSR